MHEWGSPSAAGLDAQSALVASGHAFAVTDPRLPGNPIVWVNPAFEALTGYSAAEAVGRNCRFLQGPETDAAAVDRIRQGLAGTAQFTETLRNYRADGTSWWNELTISAVLDGSGAVTHFVGVQIDASERVRADAREHSTVLALQRSLLPVLPLVPGLELAARYLPGSERAEIGGDWYDVLPLPDGSTGLAVGDVMGHDIQAAASMGQLRSVLRSYAWEGHSPAGVLDRLNQLVCGLGMAKLATCVYARIEPATADGPAVLRWANAGHPPPMLKLPDGTVQVLTDGASLLIGVNRRPGAERGSASLPVQPGATLLLYTDGLVEDPDRDIDDGLDLLRQTLADADDHLPVEQLADRLMSAAGQGHQDDDRCLLLVRIAAAQT
jgi:PAS domain S-box-containing protein